MWHMDRVPGGRTVGVSNATSFLRAVREGTLPIVATPLHRGRTLQLWQVDDHRRAGPARREERRAAGEPRPRTPEPADVS